MNFKHACNFITDDGKIGLLRCEECDTENYSPAIMGGICYSCGYDANEALKKAREAALDEMVALNQEMGLYDS